MLHALMGETHNSTYELDQALAAVRPGTGRAGRPLPTNPLLLVITTIALLLLGCWLNGCASDSAPQPPRNASATSLRPR